MKNIYGGGNQTNINGLRFEQETSLKEALLNNNFFVKDDIVYFDNKKIGELIGKDKLYSFLEKHGGKMVLSKKLKPDEAFFNYKDNKVYIVEKKFQKTAGSVDEKIQTAPFKKRQYKRLLNTINLDVEYMYLFSEWFTNPRYKDDLEYIIESGCQYYYEELPLEAIGL